jgi:RHS repeat-associated protein
MTVGDTLYGYDAAGRLGTVNRDQGANLTYAYDGSLPIDTTWNGPLAGSVTRAYDNNFRVTLLSVNGADPIALSYDLDGLLTQAGSLTLTRNAQNGLITGAALGSITETMSYDAFGDTATYTVNQSGNPVYATTYTRDALGRIASKSETIGGIAHTFAYTYDLAGRLTEVRQDNVLTASYGYDSNGNRLSRTDGTGTLTATYDAQDRLEQFGATTYVHNAAGERQSTTAAGQTTSYQYDTLGNLTRVTLPGGTQIEYLLDGAQRRVGKTRDGALVQGFLYQDGLRPIAELDAGNNVVSRFVYAGGSNVPAYMIKAGVTYAIVTDHLGSPRLVIDAATGSVAQQLDYDEFGNVILDTNPAFQPFGFAGGLYDPDTTLTRYGLRDYDPKTGRWTAKDPGGFSGGPNLYIYAANDPVNLVDPLGDSPKKLDLGSRGYISSGNSGGVYDFSKLMNYDSAANAKLPPPKPLPSEPIGRIASEPIPLPRYRLPSSGGVALPPPSAWRGVCRVVGYAGLAYNVIHDINLVRNGEWREALLDSPVGETALNVIGVIQNLRNGNVKGAAWTSAQSAVPVVRLVEGFRSGTLTLDPREWELNPLKW